MLILLTSGFLVCQPRVNVNLMCFEFSGTVKIRGFLIFGDVNQESVGVMLFTVALLNCPVKTLIRDLQILR